MWKPLTCILGFVICYSSCSSKIIINNLTRITWHDDVESAGILVHLVRNMECANSLALHQKRFGHYITRLISWLNYKPWTSRVLYIVITLTTSLPFVLCKYGAIEFGTCSFHFPNQSVYSLIAIFPTLVSIYAIAI